MGGSASREPEVHSVVVAPASGEMSAVRRNAKFKDALVETAFPEVRTLYDAFQRGLRVNKDGRCLGYRPLTWTTDAAGKKESTAGDFVWITYAETQARINAVGSGMEHLNLAPKNDTGHRLVGLFSKNRLEWVVTEHACHAFGMADVPLYDTLGAEAILFVITQTGMATVFTDAPSVGKLLKAKAEGGAALSAFVNIVCFEGVTVEGVEAAKAAGVRLLSLEAVEAAGRAHPAPHAPPTPDDLAFICYTSGTTGMPKGVMVSHRNQIADAASAYTADLGLLDRREVHLSYLPLAHIFERLVETALWQCGAAVGFYQGDTNKLMDDIKALRPTIFASVPRLYNKIHDKIRGGAAAAGGIKAALFNYAFNAKCHHLATGNTLRHSVWDKLVFAPVAKRVGLDRCHIMLTGSAPIAAHVMELLRVVFACAVVEGYGQTENSAAASLTAVCDQASLGHVGAPLACNEIALASVPEMGYLASDTTHGRVVEDNGTVTNAGIKCTGRGEVCLRGPNVFSGYYKDPARTAEALDAQGWLHTGDVGVFDEWGNLRIVDRKKNIFKLSQGEYVAAEKIENIYVKSLLVGQIFIYGDSLHAVLVAIVVPDADAATLWAKHAGGGAEALTLAQLCERSDFKTAIEQDMAKFAAEAKLQSFEKAKGIHLDPVAWTPDDLLTPSFKLKRVDAKKKYIKTIDALYVTLGDTVAGMHVRQR